MNYLKNMWRRWKQKWRKIPTTIRSQWEFKKTRPSISLDEVEPAERIVKRFKVGAMSYGSLSERSA